jgi:hypothetical protein
VGNGFDDGSADGVERRAYNCNYMYLATYFVEVAPFEEMSNRSEQRDGSRRAVRTVTARYL